MEKKDLENGLNRISDDQIPDFIAREIAEVSRREILKYLSVGVGGALGGGILLESCKFGKKGGDSGVKNSTAGNLLFQLELQPELKSNAGYTPRSTFVAEYNKLMQLKMDNLMDFANRIQAIGDKPTRVGGEVGFIAGIKIWGDRMEAFAKMTKDYLAAPGNNLLDGEDEGVVNDIVSGLEPEMQRDIVEALGALAPIKARAKEFGALFGRYLTLDPYGMFADIRNSNLPILNPMWFAPVMTTKRQDVFEVLGNTAVYQVIPYGKQMVKLLGSDGEAAGVFGRGQNTFILSTDDETLYHKDATVLKPRGADGKASFGHYGDAGVFKRSDSELIEKEIRAAIQKDIQSRFKVGQEFDVVSNVLRRVPLNLSRIFFGIPTVDRGDEAARKGDNQGGAYDMNANFVTKYKAAMTRATREFNFSTVYPEPPAGSQDILAIRKFREAKDFYDNYLPQARAEFAANKAPIADDLDIYNWVKSTFRNLFNNVPREQYVMMKGEIDGIRLMSWVYSKVVELASDKAKINPNTMAGRLLAFLDLTVDKPAMASLERITENIFGTLVGAVVGQEEGMARTIDVLLKLGDVESSYYKGPGRYTPKSSEITTLSQAFFNEAIKIASEAPSPENTKRLGVMCFEAMRLEPQGETLIRQVVTENKMGEKLGRANESTQTKVKKNQVVFAAHGSAMDDYDTAPADLRGDVYNPNRVARNPDDAAEEKEMRDVYLTHGWGRHHCLGRYVSITMIIEAARAIMQIPGVRSVEQPKEQEHFGRPKMRLIMDQNNLYAEKLMVTGTAMPTFAG